MATPEFQPQEYDPRGVSIARLISSEFGSSEAVVRQQLGLRETQLELNGVRWEGDKHFIPQKELKGKVLTVIGPERQWRMRYPENN